MATATVNGVRIHYERSGEGEVLLVLVHGSWSSHHDWDAVVPGLAESFQVVTYDRRGHSRSERPSGRTGRPWYPSSSGVRHRRPKISRYP